MRRVFYFPSASKLGYSNPYSINYKSVLKRYYYILDNENKPSKMQSLTLIINAFFADIIILNWIEGISSSKLGLLQHLIAKLALTIIRLRKKKIVWMFHNIQPHQGHTKQSKSMQSYLFKHADLIISHSKAATEYARERASNKVLYRCHPIQTSHTEIKKTSDKKDIDVLIWGAVLPYKGIAEFISYKQLQESNLNIFIVGKCKDSNLQAKIESHCTKSILFQNRYADFDELQNLINRSRYVLFPYIGECVSSSGALIDTLVMGGNIIGPNIGAFKDLAEEELCLTYTNYGELLTMLNEENSINNTKREQFVKENSWEQFAEFLKNKLTNI